MHPYRLLFSPFSSFLTRRVLAAIAACTLSGTGALHAGDTLYWKGGVTGSWFLPGYWNPNGNKVPTAADTAVLADKGHIQIASPGAVADGVYIGQIFDGQMTISSGGTLSTATTGLGRYIGTATVTGAGSRWDTDTGASSLEIGYLGGSGTLNITSGGLVNSEVAKVGLTGTSGSNSRGNVTVDGAGSTWNATNAVHLGDDVRGSATFTISNGGTANHAYVDMTGPTTDRVTTATVDGDGSTWNIGHDLWISSWGRSATLGLTNSGVLNVVSGTGKVYLGDNTRLNIGAGAAAGTFNAAVLDAHTVGGGSSPVVNFNHTGTTTFGANILQYIDVTKSGSGTTILTGTGHTFTGTTTINTGTFQIGTGGTASFGTGAVVNNAALAVNHSNTLALSGAISGTGSLTKNGSGTLALSGANSYTGNTTVNGGTVEFNSAASFGNSGTVTLAGGGLRWATGNTADISPRLAALGTAGTSFDTNGNNVSLASALTGTGGLSKNGAGTLTISGASSYTGTTTVNAGTLSLNGDGAPEFGSEIVNNSALALAPSGVLFLTAGGVSGSGTVTALSGTTVINHASSYSGETTIKGGAILNLWAPLNTNSAPIYVGYQGTGTLNPISTLTSGYAYLGRYNGDAGYATVSGSWTAPAVIVGYTGGGQLTLSAGGTLNADVQLGAYSAGVGTFNIGSGGAAGTLNATTVSGGGGQGGTVNFNHTGTFSTGAAITGKLAITKANSGTTTLSGANTFTGSTTLSDGTLALGSNTALSPNSALVINGGTLALGSYSGTAASLSGSGGSIALGGSLAVNQSGNTSFAGAISGSSGNLVKLGSGTLTLTGANAYTGTTSVNGGALSVSGSLSTGGVHVGENGFTGAVNVSGSLTANNFLTVGDNTGLTPTGGAGALTIANGGVVTLGSGAKLTVGWLNATGTLDVQSGGRLEIGGVDGLQKHATGTAAVTLSGGTIKTVHSALTTSLPMTLSGTGPAIDTNGLSATFSGALSGSGSLTKTGTGTLTLSAANTYTGNTIVNAGTLALAAASLDDAADVSIASGATLQLGFSGTDTIGKLYLNGVAQPAGVWGGMSSTAPNKSPYLTGTGLLNVAASGAMTFAGWISTFGLTGSDALASADPDHDGIANLLEWVLGGNPAISDAGILPDPVVTATDWVFTFHRTDESEAEVALVFQYGSNLAGWTDVAIGATGGGQVTVNEGTPESEPDLITVTLPRNSNPKLFGRLKAVK